MSLPDQAYPLARQIRPVSSARKDAPPELTLRRLMRRRRRAHRERLRHDPKKEPTDIRNTRYHVFKQSTLEHRLFRILSQISRTAKKCPPRYDRVVPGRRTRR